MEYSCHIIGLVPLVSCNLELLDKPQIQTCMTDGKCITDENFENSVSPIILEGWKAPSETIDAPSEGHWGSIWDHLLPKIEELWIIANSTNAVIIGISESKLNAFVLEPEIQIDDYKILWCDRNRHGGGVTCFIKNGLSYNILSVFPREIETIFFEIILPNSKPITVGTIYHPPNQSNFLEVLNENINNINKLVTQQDIIEVLPDRQLIFCTNKISRIKRGTHKH